MEVELESINRAVGHTGGLPVARVVEASLSGLQEGIAIVVAISAGIQSIDGGQTEAARSLGLSSWQSMRLVVLPQAIKNILPTLGNEFIVLLKDTSLITVIGGKELLYAAQSIYGRTYEQMFPLLGVACVYLALVMIFSWLVGILERRLRKSDNR